MYICTALLPWHTPWLEFDIGSGLAKSATALGLYVACIFSFEAVQSQPEVACLSLYNNKSAPFGTPSNSYEPKGCGQLGEL
jgi:hypothetical protein